MQCGGSAGNREACCIMAPFLRDPPPPPPHTHTHPTHPSQAPTPTSSPSAATRSARSTTTQSRSVGRSAAVNRRWAAAAAAARTTQAACQGLPGQYRAHVSPCVVAPLPPECSSSWRTWQHAALYAHAAQPLRRLVRAPLTRHATPSPPAPQFPAAERAGAAGDASSGQQDQGGDAAQVRLVRRRRADAPEPAMYIRLLLEQTACPLPITPPLLVCFWPATAVSFITGGCNVCSASMLCCKTRVLSTRGSLHRSCANESESVQGEGWRGAKERSREHDHLAVGRSQHSGERERGGTASRVQVACLWLLGTEGPNARKVLTSLSYQAEAGMVHERGGGCTALVLRGSHVATSGRGGTGRRRQHRLQRRAGGVQRRDHSRRGLLRPTRKEGARLSGRARKAMATVAAQRHQAAL